jgi:imidazoleglycerol-phosphate dehydratase
VNRSATRTRSTAETEVAVTARLDGSGVAAVDTGIGFLDHLLTSFSHHALIDLEITTRGDLEVDDHHTVEDTALVLGECLAAALGDRHGIARFGDAAVPMDEALAEAVVDAGGRPYAVIDLELRTDRIGTLTAQNLPHALEAFARTAGFTMHLTARGRNDHHVAEAAVKALARAVRAAIAPDSRRRGVPSTKGTAA